MSTAGKQFESNLWSGVLTISGSQLLVKLLSLSSVGIPSTISKLVALAEAARNHRRSEEIFRTAMALFFIIDLFCAELLYLSADFLARPIAL